MRKSYYFVLAMSGIDRYTGRKYMCTILNFVEDDCLSQKPLDIQSCIKRTTDLYSVPPSHIFRSVERWINGISDNPLVQEQWLKVFGIDISSPPHPKEIIRMLCEEFLRRLENSD